MDAYDALRQTIFARVNALETDWPRKVRDATTCPANMLGHLGWSRCLDYWDYNWSDAVKRELIRTSPLRLRVRGTRSAIEAAVAGFGGEIVIQEWWESDPAADNMTATASVSFGGSVGSSSDTQDLVLRLLEREGRKALEWNLLVGAGGASAIAPESYLRATVLWQHKGAQVG